MNLTAATLIFDEWGRVLLIKENYGQYRYGPPGGTVEPGEWPLQAAVREAMEETGVVVRVQHLIGCYAFTAEPPWLAFAFRCAIQHGSPKLPVTGEIAEVGWFDPRRLPSPLTNLAPHAIADALRDERGVMRELVAR